MDGSLRASIRKSFAITLVLAAVGVGYLVRASGGSPSARPSATHAPVRLTKADLLRAAATATAGISLQFDTVTNPPSIKHDGHAKILSFQFGVSRTVDTSGGGRQLGKLSVQEITLTHQTDKYSLPLLDQSVKAPGGVNAIVYFTNLNVGGKLVDYLEFDLSDVIVTQFSMSSGGTDLPTEALSLNFTSATVVAHIEGSQKQVVSFDLF